MFRVRQPDGNFRWQEFDALAVGPEKEGNILICIKDAPPEHLKDKDIVLPEVMKFFHEKKGQPEADSPVSRFNLLKAMKQAKEIKFFWKDTQRRFLGASRGFLDYYGIHDESSILGKTDEEMGWHIDAEPYKSIEEKVLREGLISRRALGKCIIRGRVHTIRATKIPLYEDNKIVGLLGYFEDMDRERKIYEKDLQLGLVDEETGLTGFRGMMMAGLRYYSNFARSAEDFAAILLHIPELEEVHKLYGHEVYLALLAKVSRMFARFSPLKKTLGHLSDGKFLIFMKYKNSMKVKTHLLRLANDIHAIKEIQGRPVTLYLQRATAYGSETNSLDGLMHLLTERLDEAEQQGYGQSIYVGDRIAFDREAFDTSEQNVMMARMDNYEVIYINKAGLRDLGLSSDFNYQGMKCHKLLCGLDYPCEDCPHMLLRRDRFYTRTYHNNNLGRDYLIQHILVPWRGQNCHLEMATNLHHYMEDEIRQNEMLFKEMAVNDAIEIGLREENPSVGIQNMLARVGEILECEKACIAEEMPDGTVRNTYEWCREDIPSTIKDLQSVPREDVQFIYDNFGTDQVAIIENVTETLHKYGKSKPHMPGIKSLISGHLFIAGQSIGYTEIVNPSAKVLKEASPLLATLTRFLAIMVRNRDMVQSLNRMSYIDVMTDTGNRRAFLKYIQEVPDGEEMAFIFGDMNGLKSINDHFGHKDGDRAIRIVADIMKEMAGCDNVFRMGGDEFIIVIDDMNRQRTTEFIDELKHRIHAEGISMAFGASLHKTPIDDIDAIITEADRAMYRDKKHPRK